MATILGMLKMLGVKNFEASTAPLFSILTLSLGGFQKPLSWGGYAKLHIPLLFYRQFMEKRFLTLDLTSLLILVYLTSRDQIWRLQHVWFRFYSLILRRTRPCHGQNPVNLLKTESVITFSKMIIFQWNLATTCIFTRFKH